jgi:hypothetical protein
VSPADMLAQAMLSRLVRTSILSAILSVAASAPALGRPGMGADLMSAGKAPVTKQGLSALLDGWSNLCNGWLLFDMFGVLLLALLLGAAIGYHPSIRRHHTTLEQFEQPKTLLMYAVVAAVVALIVQVQPAMAFVIFGIGGLLRFRTDVGEAKDTGRVILVTVVGVCCGLKIYVVAFPATIIGWLAIYWLERQLTGTIRISGVGQQSLQEATRTYRATIVEAGCTVIAEQSKFTKREFEFVVAAPARLEKSKLQACFDALPPELRGVVVWEGL